MIPHIDYSLVGQRMQRLRKAKGYTQEQIANDLNVTIAFISNIENNRAKMNLRILTYYASLLNVSVDYLLQPGKEEDENSIYLDQEILRLLRDYPVAEKQKFIKMLRALKE